MQASGNTVLITGGASGIGLALAARFLSGGNQVIICGRRESKLQEAKDKYPQLHTKVCDVAEESGRVALLEWIKSEFPQTNILVNNAGIQNRVNLVEPKEPWSELRSEITVNLESPIHLSMLFIPHLKEKENAAIINVTSGLSFVPLAFVPIYCATKAALHSFTLSLRHQLSKSTNIKVIEVAPPAVDTDLGGVGLHTFGVNVDEFADAVWRHLAEGQVEIGYGMSERAMKASKAEADEMFKQMNSRG
jgi:uncharacterized oxidoreductase